MEEQCVQTPGFALELVLVVVLQCQYTGVAGRGSVVLEGLGASSERSCNVGPGAPELPRHGAEAWSATQAEGFFFRSSL